MQTDTATNYDPAFLKEMSLPELASAIEVSYEDMPIRAAKHIARIGKMQSLTETDPDTHRTGEQEARSFLEIAGENWDGPEAEAFQRELTRRVEVLEVQTFAEADPAGTPAAEQVAVAAEESLDLVHEYQDAVEAVAEGLDAAERS